MIDEPARTPPVPAGDVPDDAATPRAATVRRFGLPTAAPAAAFLAAILGHLPVLGAWWCRDDWGLLARAAGLSEGPTGVPARWLSQHLYWQATWPLFGLDPLPHAWIRLLLHGASAALVARLARRGGLGEPAAAVAGCVFAASPLAFTPLYWAAGIQELLAAALALLAVDRWLRAGRQSAGGPGRRELAGAVLAAVGSLAAKEPGLGLALLFGALTLTPAAGRPAGRRTVGVVVAIAATAAAGLGAAVLATRHFDHGPGAPYALGNAATAAANLSFALRWLALPGPVVDARANTTALASGALLLAAWLAWGVVAWRRGRRLALTALAASLLALAPLLPLRHHLAPYMAYLAVAGWALTLASLVPGRLPRPRAAIAAVLVASTAWGLFATNTVIKRRNELGLPADDLVRATSLSWEAREVLGTVAGLADGPPVRQVVLLQVPAGPGALERARQFGERWAGRSDLHEALGGDFGLALMLPAGVHGRWANGLVTAPDSAVVLVETGTGLLPWGRTGQAAMYAALTDIGLGHFERGRDHLVRAAQLGGPSLAFACDAGLMPIPLELALQQREAFTDWTVGLLAEGASRHEVGGLQDLYFNLLCACTGRSLDELTRGSHLLLRGDPPAAPAPRP
ncbi:MAG: hypothetical protein IPK64_13960 [bacterium]|nr:hypothetical protein [bacterium]